MVRRLPPAAALVLLAGAAATFLLIRPGVVTTAAGAPSVSVECSAATGLDEAACREWSDGVIAAGAPSSTFEMTDLGRLRLDRDLFGFASTCRTEWFITRYDAEPVWTDEGSCPAR